MAVDYNVDGEVDAADHAVWKAAFSSTTLPYVDESFKGVVDAADFTVWRDNLGASSFGSGGGSVATVPEPVAWLLVLKGATCLPWLPRINHPFSR